MNERIIKYINDNSDLLNTNIRHFIATAMWRLLPKDVEELVIMLKAAELSVDSSIDELIQNHLSFVFSVVNDRTPLMQVISDGIIHPSCRTYLGRTSSDLKQFIIDNQEKWDSDMTLEKDDHGTYIVRTNYDHGS